MQLSIEEVKKLDSNSYQIIDIRSEERGGARCHKGSTQYSGRGNRVR